MQLINIHTDALILHHAVDQQMTDQHAIHCHNFYEIFYFISGDVSYLVEGKRYVLEPHSLLLIAPHVFHGVRIESDLPYERISLHFVPGFLPPENQSLLLSPFHADPPTTGIYYTDNGDQMMYPFFKQLMAARLADESIRDLSLRVRLEALLSQVLMSRYSLAGPTDHDTTTRTVARVIQYLNDHITESITLDHLSDKFFVSKHHLNKIFRTATGSTVWNYVIHKRIVMAQNLMMQGQSATSAASAVGFQDYSSFYRSYKKVLGHAPSVKQAPILLG
ncbi:AraC family transcriptional regulator [Paenibacillus sp. JCM 10914]|uniref:AraC family transcriptional regulator n=1 Tax=Paenibacillus sp. JCM 10914 TaxID=1236974 RepID=UPI0003CC6A57|nr:AraC family transcriptional regulator [Paenibacillus sp. JCM 10914]GAE07470.1 transcriptional regulator of rhamnose utilization, AraC family [Paenibacillus sp. JCM 10914]